MKKSVNFLFAALLIAMSLSSCQKSETRSKAATSGIITIENVWARPAAKGQNSAAYMSIYNKTLKPDTLLEIQSASAARAEVHESYTTEEGLSGMRPAGNLIIAPGDSLILKPGGFHIMLMKVSKDLAETDSLELQLRFAQSGRHKHSVPIQK